MCIHVDDGSFFPECVPYEYIQDVLNADPRNTCGECPIIPTETPTFQPTTAQPTPWPTPFPTPQPPVCLDNECAGDQYVYICFEFETFCVSQDDAKYLLDLGGYCGKCAVFTCTEENFSCGNKKVLICHM